MPKAGDIKYCPALGGRETNAVFVYVPPSACWMGEDVKNIRNFTYASAVSKGFWIQQTPLTNLQLSRIRKNYKHKDDMPAVQKYREIDFLLANVEPEFLRMPTDAEWMLAARAGTGRKYRLAGSNVLKNVKKTSEDADSEKVEMGPVAALRPNSYGMFDMSNFFSEWCSDFYTTTSDTNPKLDFSEVDTTDAHIVKLGRGKPYESLAMLPHDLELSEIGVRLVWEL